LTRLTLIALPVRCGPPALTSGAAIMLGVALAAAPTAALADAQVRGSRDAVTVEARNTSVEEILKALSGTFDVHYRSSANLQTRLTGNYEGSLQRVMRRVLDGYSYFTKVGDGGIEITVLDANPNASSFGASPPFRVVERPQDDVPAQPLPAIAPLEPSVIPAPRAAPSTEAAPSFRSVERLESQAPAQPSSAGIVEPPKPPAAPAAPSSRQRDHLVAASGTESRPLPPRRIKVASGPHHWKKRKHHARRTRLAKSASVCGRPVRSLGASMMTPVSSYFWLPQEPFRYCPPRRYPRSQKS
jgi:hypothetical protein